MPQPTVRLSQLIKAFDQQIARGGPRKADAIASVETMFDVYLPPDYRQFLGNYGYLSGEHLTIFGLSDRDLDVPSVVAVTMMLRLTYVEMPLELIPVEALDDTHYACIYCASSRKEAAPVVLLDTDSFESADRLVQLASDFETYLVNRLISLLPQDSGSEAQPSDSEMLRQAWERFEYWVYKFQRDHEYDHAAGGKLPRNHEWRPYRYCIQDVVFGLLVVRHNREGNWLDIDVFLTAEVPEYGPLAGAQALTSFILSEAYKCGGTMELHFSEYVEGQQVPQELQQLAERYGITFAQANRGIISSTEAKALYAALTDFSPRLQDAINQLEAEGCVKMARACYVVHHGVWSKEQVEMIVLGSERPDSILGDMTQPQQWQLYQHDLLHARAALLAGMLERLLKQRVHQQEGVEYDWEDDVRPIDITFDGDLYAKCYYSEDEMPIPAGWLYGAEEERMMHERTPIHVLIRARDVSDLLHHLNDDIQQAADYHRATGEPTFVLLPADFDLLPYEQKQRLVSVATGAQIGLLVSPDSVLTFDADAAQKLARSRVLRQ